MKTFKQLLSETTSPFVLVSDIESVIRGFKQLHWNVNGANFLALHEIYGDVYESLIKFQDRIAEKMRSDGNIVSLLPPRTQQLEFRSTDSIESAVFILTDLRTSVGQAEATTLDITYKNILGELSETLDSFLYKIKSHRVD